MNFTGVQNLKRKDGKVKVILLLLLLAVIVFAVLFGTGLIGGGFGFGGGGNSDNADNNSDNGVQTSVEEESNVIAIRIEESSIYFGDELCSDVEALEQKIIEVGNSKEYELIHDSAIKSVYDEVIEVLTELETALEIKVEYN